MSLMIGKGTILKTSGATTTLAAVAQVLDISLSGQESETYDSSTVDGPVGKTYAATGYSEGGSLDFSCFFDSSLAGHQVFTDTIAAPADITGSLVWTGATTEVTFTAAGVGFGADVAMDDGVKASVSLKLTGLMAHDS
jgi:hypothetical protein